MSDQDILVRAMKEHCRLTREIAAKDKLIAKLKEPAKLVREAIDMFCPPYLRASADKWLETMEL